MSYADFLAKKKRVWTGIGHEPESLPPQLYDWQAAITRWALRKGRAAIFADCGLGKTFMQVAWANALPGRVLLLAPLCVAEQTVAEAAKLGIEIHYAHHATEGRGHRLVITNYERLEHFDPSEFCGVVLDESSILKAFDGKTRTRLIETFKDTTYRLCCTATPSPNDISELANHAEFLGLMTRPEFLATWFVRVGSGHRTVTHHGWRMKRHAVTPFYRWLSSWAVALRHPADLGYESCGFDLPPLNIRDRIIDAGPVDGVLFPELSVYGLQGRLAARRGSLEDRVAVIRDLVATNPGPWILWCGLNTEADALAAAIPDAINVQGNDTHAEKAGAVNAFVDGRVRVLISKVRILGYGLNFQHCSQMAFVGLGDSYEQYYQAIRRCWRYRQQRPVDVYVVVSEAETVVVENVRRKEIHASDLSAKLLEHMREFLSAKR